jgi:hypothetical protein
MEFTFHNLFVTCLLYLNFGVILFIAPKHFFIIWFSNISILSVPDEGYSRKASYALNLISTFLFLDMRVDLRIHNLSSVLINH